MIPDAGPRGVPLVDVRRGDLIESVHAVAACAVDAHGDVMLALGDVEAPIYLRSSAKPFIAAAVVESGAAARFGLSAAEIALIAASHAGEPRHIALARSILRKIGLDETYLQCGAPPDGSPIEHNCSGKHAGILAMCLATGTDPLRYVDVAHPVQQRILAFCARMLDADPSALAIGVDGCGIPVFATSLRSAARAFARLATLEGMNDVDARALALVRSAMAAEPWLIAGTGRFDTRLSEVTRGLVIGKSGAEGVHADALLRCGAGLVLKVVDGAARATPPAAMALLGELGAFEGTEEEQLQSFARPEVRTVAGRVVGAVTTRVLRA